MSDCSGVQINQLGLEDPEKVLLLPAGAAFLHHLCSVVPGQLAEAIVAVDDGPVHNLGISQHKVGVCLTVNKRKERKTTTNKPA